MLVNIMKTILKKVYQSNVQMLSDTLVLADDENYEKEKCKYYSTIG